MQTVGEAGRTAAGYAAAHQRLMDDRTLQFAFTEAPPPDPPPAWMEALARLLKALAPYAEYVFWGLAIIGVALLGWFVAREAWGHLWRSRRPPKPQTEAAPWRPRPEQARALLEEADRLAGQARFAEAAHVLLLRSIDDFQGRRPDLVRPALTSRDIGRLAGLPEAGRPAFTLIAQVVERSLFGGRPVDSEAYGRCRQAYADFALPGVWT